MHPTVRLQGVGKRYVKYEDVPLLITRALRFRAGHRRTHLWALRNIDLEVARGESFGVIGRNGSGKSTMLRMLAGVTAPTEGVVQVRGRVAPLIAVGVGFHPELTGRENVYVNGIVLGLSKKEIDGRLDSIVAWADIEEFIDTPVKFYSSGMFVRLGFSVAVAADPEVLLVDEVLAVGDLAFQIRCFDRMEEIRRQGATVLVVSHNLNAIRKLCTRTMLLHHGAPVFVGDTDDAISRYHDIIGATAREGEGEGEETAEVQVLGFELLGEDATRTAHVTEGEEVSFRCTVLFRKDAKQPFYGIVINHEAGQLVYAEGTLPRDAQPVSAGSTVAFDIRLRAALPTATYTAVAVVKADPGEFAPRAKSPSISFFVSGRAFVKGVADLHAAFEIASVDAVPSPK